MRVGGNGLPKGFPKSTFDRLPAGQIVNRRFTDEEEDDRHHQERAEHKAQHPGWRHVVSQKARGQVAEGHPALLRQKHNRQDPAAVRVGGQEVIGGITRIQAQ